MFDQLPEWIKMIGAALGGLGAGGYAVQRRLKADRTSDALDGKAKAIIDKLEAQLDRERQQNTHLGEVIDRVAKERNEAVQQVGRLEGTVQALEKEVGRLSGEVEGLEQQNKSLTQEITGLHGEMRNLSDRVAILLHRMEGGMPA